MSDRNEQIPQHWGEKRYYSLDCYLKQTFGEKVYRLALNGGMTCPNRDGTLGTGGCIFCSAGGSGDFAASSVLSIPEQIETAKARIVKKTDCKKFIAYFQAYTNTYADIEYLRKIYYEAVLHPDIAAVSIATRPDCIEPSVLTLLTEINRIKPVWIELGLQTIHAETAAFIRSGFDYACFLNAAERLRSAGLSVIVHLILGLPGETKEMMLASVDAVASLPADGIKLQLLHVLKNTELAEYYNRHPFPMFTLEEYCRFIPECLSRLPKEMVVHRITGDGPADLLLAPAWSLNKRETLNTIAHQMKIQHLYQGCRSNS